MFRKFLSVTNASVIALVLFGCAADKTIQKSAVSQQETIDCLTAWNVVDGYHNGQKQIHFFEDTDAEEAADNLKYWNRTSKYLNTVSEKTLQDNYTTGINGNTALFRMTEAKIFNCKGLRKNNEILQGKPPTYPDAMTHTEVAENFQARREKSRNQPLIKHSNDEVEKQEETLNHMITVLCKIHFDSKIANFKNIDSSDGMTLYEGFVEQKTYWSNEYSSLPKAAADNVRTKMAEEIKRAKAGNDPLRTVMCLEQHAKQTK